jgi:hypothetical protein
LTCRYLGSLYKPPDDSTKLACTRSNMLGLARPVLTVVKLRCTASNDLSIFSICIDQHGIAPQSQVRSEALQSLSSNCPQKSVC